MAFTDLGNFTRMLPAEYKDSIQSDYDTLRASVRGFTIAVRVDERKPYERIRIVSTESPVEFCATAHFDPCEGDAFRTDFSLEIDANFNLMMKAMVGGKIKEALDRIVDSLAIA